MCLLVESLMIKNGWIYNLDIHEDRLNNSMRTLFNVSEFIELEDCIHSALSSFVQEKGENAVNGKLKCRVLYDRQIRAVEIDPYIARNIQSLKLVYDNSIDYTYKTNDRSALQNIFAKREQCDDILIVKNGFITDSYAANVLFFDGEDWYTPSNPLLKGTQRRLLLETNVIKEAEIGPDDISKYQKVRLINALNQFEDKVDIEICNVFK